MNLLRISFRDLNFAELSRNLRGFLGESDFGLGGSCRKSRGRGAPKENFLDFLVLQLNFNYFRTAENRKEKYFG